MVEVNRFTQSKRIFHLRAALLGLDVDLQLIVMHAHERIGCVMRRGVRPQCTQVNLLDEQAQVIEATRLRPLW